MLELAIWMYHIGNPDPVVRAITDVATGLVILWGVVNHYAKKESDKEFMDVYNEIFRTAREWNYQQVYRISRKCRDLCRTKKKHLSKCWKMSLKHSLQSFTQVGHCGKEETSTSQSAGK